MPFHSGRGATSKDFCLRLPSQNVITWPSLATEEAGEVAGFSFFGYFVLNLGHDHCEENRESNSEKEMEMDIGELASATIFILMICLLMNIPY